MKVGDKIICIDNSNILSGVEDRTPLILNGIYYIWNITGPREMIFIGIGNDLSRLSSYGRNCGNWYYSWRFLTLKEHRRRKLEKLECD